MTNASKKEQTTTPFSITTDLNKVRVVEDVSVQGSGSFVVREGRSISGSTQTEITHVCVSGVRVVPTKPGPSDTTN